MTINMKKRAVGLFTHRRDAEQALHELRDSGFPMERVSVINKNKDDGDTVAGKEVTEKVGDQSDEGAKVGAVSGGVLGGLTGLLVGLGTLAIPGIGPIMLAGAAATALATTVAGASIGAVAGSLIGALVGLGIPEERAKVYNAGVERGDYLVIVDGTDAEIAATRAIFQRRGVEEFEVYDHPNDVNPAANVVDRGVNTTPQGERRAIGAFAHRRDAESALSALRNAGFPMSRVSLIAKDANDGLNRDLDRDKSVEVKEGAKTGAATGGALGGLGGLLVGLGTLAIPAIGPVIVGGAAATALATTLAGGALGATVGGIAGGLVGLGIPKEQAQAYSDRFQRGDYLVIVDGTDAEIRQAETILRPLGIEDFATFDGTDIRHHHTNSDVVDRGVNTTPQGDRRAVGVFAHRRDAESALSALRNAGFPMSRVSLIAKDANDGLNRDLDSDKGDQVKEGVKAGAATGGALGGLGGLLVGLGTLAIPAIGPVVVAGAAATALATTLAGGALGATVGGIAGGLVGLGIPQEQAQVYSDRFQRGDYLVIVDGTNAEIHQAETILRPLGIEEFATFNGTDIRHHQTNSHPVARTEAVSGNYDGQAPVVVINHRDKMG